MKSLPRGVPVVLACSSLLLGVERAASADKVIRHEKWEATWQAGVSGPKSSCLHTEELRGKNCGADDSVQIVVTNTCAEPIRMSSCLERADGKLDCGLNSKLGAKEIDHGVWTCHASGKWRIVACAVDGGCRADADVVLRIMDSSVVLSSCVEDALAPVAEGMFQATGAGVVVTDGARTPRRQAVEMDKKLRAGEPLNYQEAALAKELSDAWHAIPETDRAAKGIDTLEALISNQVAKKKFVSRHLRKSAADLRTKDLSPDQVAKLKELILGAKLEIFDEPKAAGGPHIHVNVSGCD